MAEVYEHNFSQLCQGDENADDKEAREFLLVHFFHYANASLQNGHGNRCFPKNAEL